MSVVIWNKRERIVLDTDIPIPLGRKEKWGWLLDMEPGHSRLIEDPTQYNALRSTARYYAREYNIKFRTKKESGGLRIWRIK